MIDVLYLLSLLQVIDFLRFCYLALRPHGILVIKDAIRSPYWKFIFTQLQEILAVKVFRITEGRTVSIHSEEEIVHAIVKAGFERPEIQRLDEGYPYPHTLFRARKVSVP